MSAGAIPQASALATRTSSTNYKVVYSFREGNDGANPGAGVSRGGDGTLDGTTIAGGGNTAPFSLLNEPPKRNHGVRTPASLQKPTCVSRSRAALCVTLSHYQAV